MDAWAGEYVADEEVGTAHVLINECCWARKQTAIERCPLHNSMFPPAEVHESPPAQSGACSADRASPVSTGGSVNFMPEGGTKEEENSEDDLKRLKKTESESSL